MTSRVLAPSRTVNSPSPRATAVRMRFFASSGVVTFSPSTARISSPTASPAAANGDFLSTAFNRTPSFSPTTSTPTRAREKNLNGAVGSATFSLKSQLG